MKLPELVYQDESRNNRSCRVGDRDADPYAKCSEPSGKNQQAGNEEQHLPGERKKDRLLRHPDGKEKVCRHHLETDNRKDRKDDMQTVHRRLDQLRIGRKHADDHRREQQKVRIYDEEGRFIGIYEYSEIHGDYKPVKLFMEA